MKYQMFAYHPEILNQHSSEESSQGARKVFVFFFAALAAIFGAAFGHAAGTGTMGYSVFYAGFCAFFVGLATTFSGQSAEVIRQDFTIPPPPPCREPKGDA